MDCGGISLYSATLPLLRELVLPVPPGTEEPWLRLSLILQTEASGKECSATVEKYLRLLDALSQVNLLKPTGYGMHQQVEYFNNCTLCPHCIYVFCICMRTNVDLCNLHKKN
jgi:hypothetical protein